VTQRRIGRLGTIERTSSYNERGIEERTMEALLELKAAGEVTGAFFVPAS
jgi:hypothetical protein